MITPRRNPTPPRDHHEHLDQGAAAVALLLPVLILALVLVLIGAFAASWSATAECTTGARTQPSSDTDRTAAEPDVAQQHDEGRDCTAPTAAGSRAGAELPSGAVGAMLTAALAQRGDPYVFGAVGPDSFDCSGLIVYSWAQAGYRVTIRTAAQMWNYSTPVARGSEQPGDLLFGEFGTRVPGAGHVMIVVKEGLAVQAPSTGRNVQLTDYTSFGADWRLARFKPGALTPLPNVA